MVTPLQSSSLVRPSVDGFEGALAPTARVWEELSLVGVLTDGTVVFPVLGSFPVFLVLLTAFLAFRSSVLTLLDTFLPNFPNWAWAFGILPAARKSINRMNDSFFIGCMILIKEEY
ncbi:MAG: hypothetical protein AB3N10_01400 [Allomuricauda sp.]